MSYVHPDFKLKKVTYNGPGKGPARRDETKEDRTKFEENYDRIFGKKPKRKPAKSRAQPKKRKT